jgi:hypothetical protein
MPRMTEADAPTRRMTPSTSKNSVGGSPPPARGERPPPEERLTSRLLWLPDSAVPE